MEQQEYENGMLRQHYPVAHDAHDNDRAIGSESDTSTKGKVKNFWHNKVAPAFSEATADFNILQDFIHVERKVKEDMVDIHCFPEIMRVAEVRRGLDLGLEVETIHPDEKSPCTR